MGGHFWPFTDLLQEIRPEIPEKVKSDRTQCPCANARPNEQSWLVNYCNASLVGISQFLIFPAAQPQYRLLLYYDLCINFHSLQNHCGGRCARRDDSFAGNSTKCVSRCVATKGIANRRCLGGINC